MQKIKAILVDDEQSARDVLENLLLRFCPEVELLDKCENVLQAVESIKKHQPNVVFLDIEMPNYAGFEIVNFFTEINFKIIFVTAYEKYAIRAFEVSAINYLLKPIEINRLKNAVEKTVKEFTVLQQLQSLSVAEKTFKDKEIRNLVISEKGNQYIVSVNDILAIEAQESYCTIYTKNRKYMVSKNLKYYEVLFESVPKFFRTHKSWIINTDCIEFYSKSDFTITLSENLKVKLSKYKKAEFENIVNRD